MNHPKDIPLFKKTASFLPAVNVKVKFIPVLFSN
jgi:hypothetical protein